MLVNDNLYNAVLKESLANSPLALVFWIIEQDKIAVIDWNIVSEKVFGWTKDEIIGKDFFDYIIPESERLSVYEVVKMIKENQYPNININKNITKNKEVKIVKWFNTPIKDDDNNILYVISLGEDITEIETYKQKVKESEERYRLLFDKMISGFAYHEIILDDNGNPIDYRFLEVNPEFERLTGLKAKDIIGKTIKEIFPNLESFWIEKYGEIAISGESCEFEDYSSSLDKYYSIRAYSPEKYKFASIFNDITPAKKAEENLLKQKYFYESIIEKLQESIIVCDENDNITYVNQSFLIFSGVTQQVILGRNILKDFTNILPNTIFKDYIKAKEEKIPIKSERHSILLPSGKFAYISGWIIPIVANNLCEKIIINFEDVTEKIISENEIKHLNRVFSIISNINQAIVREKHLDSLLEKICKIVVDYGGFILSWIGFYNENENIIEVKAIYSKDKINIRPNEKIKIDEIPLNCQNVLKSGSYIIDNNIDIEEQNLYKIINSNLSNCCSSATFPLILQDKVIGFIELFSDEIGIFDTEEQKLLSELSADISFAIEHYKLEQERLKAEIRIKELNRNLKTILDYSPAGIINLSTNGDVLSWNKSAELILGWKEEEAIGQNIYNIYPHLTSKINLLRDTLIQQHKIYDYEITLDRKDGASITLNVSATPVLTENNDVVSVIAIIFDITEQKLSEEALIESERRFEELLKNIELIAVMLDKKGRITFCNDYLLKITGWSKNEILGKNWFEYFLTDEVRKIFEPNFSDYMQNKQLPLHYENEIFTKEGKRLLINWNNTYYTNDYGETIGLLSIGEDITIKRKSEEEIKKLNKDLERKIYEKTRELERALIDLKYENVERKKTAEILKLTTKDLANSLEKEKQLNELKSNFIDIIIHQYRTPLSIILSSSTLISKYLELKDYVKINNYLSKIKSSAKNMLRLLEDVLIVAQEHPDKMKPKLETFNLNELFYEVIESVSQSDEKSHHFELHTNPETIHIYSDKNFIKQILVNIASNAVNFSEQGTIITTNIYDLDTKIQITIQDQGVGISSEEMKYLFDTFYRGKDVGESFGSGLGLPIAKKLLDILGGTIEVQSQVGVGSTFIINIPKKL